MSILVYANSNNPAVKGRLLSIVESKAPCNLVELYQSFEVLTERVRRLPKNIAIAVLMAQDEIQLCELIALKGFLEDVPIILILPNQDKRIISQATKLFPSFISSLESDFDLLGEVLERMLKLRDIPIAKGKIPVNTC